MRYTYKRHAIHIESIGGGRAGLFLGPSGVKAEGPEGWMRVRSDGAVQLEDGEPYISLPVCATTGALVLPDGEQGD